MTVRIALFLSVLAACLVLGCAAPKEDPHVAANIKMYTETWDAVMNKGKIELINETNFSHDILIHSGGETLRGVDTVRAYYGAFLTGFSNIEFTINDVFGQGDKLVKYWTFKGTHTGMFAGIPPTGKAVVLEGSTLVRMENGKIAEERDFFDNLSFLQQLGVIPK
jgi:steroid delta-isomerase-like uncharacterized protein